MYTKTLAEQLSMSHTFIRWDRRDACFEKHLEVGKSRSSMVMEIAIEYVTLKKGCSYVAPMQLEGQVRRATGRNVVKSKFSACKSWPYWHMTSRLARFAQIVGRSGEYVRNEMAKSEFLAELSSNTKYIKPGRSWTRIPCQKLCLYINSRTKRI